MSFVPARFRKLAFVAALLTIAACGAETATATVESGVLLLRVRNTGTVTLTNVSVTVDEGATPITIATLSPGQTTDYYGRPSAHEYPLVSADANGESLIAHPVEGFLPGFNPALEDGSYTIGIAVVNNQSFHGLDVRVTRED